MSPQPPRPLPTTAPSWRATSATVLVFPASTPRTYIPDLPLFPLYSVPATRRVFSSRHPPRLCLDDLHSGAADSVPRQRGDRVRHEHMYRLDGQRLRDRGPPDLAMVGDDHHAPRPRRHGAQQLRFEVVDNRGAGLNAEAIHADEQRVDA